MKKPLFWKFNLKAINNFLIKQAMFITNSTTMSWKFKEASESRKQAAKRPSPPFPRPASASSLLILAKKFQVQKVLFHIHPECLNLICYCPSKRPSKNSMDKIIHLLLISRPITFIRCNPIAIHILTYHMTQAYYTDHEL